MQRPRYSCCSPSFDEDSDARDAAEVERILSNLMAHIAALRSRTCWRKTARKAEQLAQGGRPRALAGRSLASGDSLTRRCVRPRLLLASHPAHTVVKAVRIVGQRLADTIYLIVGPPLREGEQLSLKLRQEWCISGKVHTT